MLEAKNTFSAKNQLYADFLSETRERSRDTQTLLETRSDFEGGLGTHGDSRHIAIRKPTLVQTGCVSQGYQKENVASRNW